MFPMERRQAGQGTLCRCNLHPTKQNQSNAVKSHHFGCTSKKCHLPLLSASHEANASTTLIVFHLANTSYTFCSPAIRRKSWQSARFPVDKHFQSHRYTRCSPCMGQQQDIPACLIHPAMLSIDTKLKWTSCQRLVHKLQMAATSRSKTPAGARHLHGARQKNAARFERALHPPV